MAKPIAELLRGKKSTHEYAVWSNWLDAAATISGRYVDFVSDDDPFAYNETASVSVLAAAAAVAGYIGLAEFSTAKKNQADRSHGWGRSDFWMSTQKRAWAFEFKQWNPSTPPRVNGRLQRYMGTAVTCAKQILRADADAAVAALVLPLYWLADEAIDRARENLSQFASTCDFVWRIQGDPTKRETYLFFNVVRRFY